MEVDGKRKTWHVNKSRTFQVLGSAIGSMNAEDDYKYLIFSSEREEGINASAGNLTAGAASDEPYRCPEHRQSHCRAQCLALWGGHPHERWRNDRYRGRTLRPAASSGLDCTDPTTMESLIEVKYLLKSLLKKSEDLRRGLTQQARDGVELLKLLNQRFLFLLRFMNTETDHGQILMSEMQDLGQLVESSYTAILVAQNAFIDSCNRIQIEEPTLELKITEILDKLVTNIDLGQEFNRQQLSELRKVVVERLGTDTTTNTLPSPATTVIPQDEMEGNVKEDQGLTPETSVRLGLLRDVIAKAIQTANVTVIRLESVEERVEGVSSQLLQTDWTNLRQKEPADQLVTAAKDLKGYAQEQMIQSLKLHEALLTTLEHITINSSVARPHILAMETSLPVDENDADITVKLPPSCTAALLQHVRNLPDLPRVPTTTTHTIVEEEEDSEEDIPAWYTDPDFLSGNYGTPDRGFPVFREEEWIDMEEGYALEGHQAPHTTSSEPPRTRQKTVVTPGGIDRYFGVERTVSSQSLNGKQASRTEDFP
ncbi:uncharacterized protein [Panulirus ornatus]|uniref:uncharacterized protein n=1 Tax=Panulirus ornatus TaxID=150431 RepID=UPI003A8C0BA3